MAWWDRVFRIFLGVFLTAFAIAGGPFWAYIGVFFLLTAGWGFCPFYAFFKVRTLRSAPRSSQMDDPELSDLDEGPL